MWVLTFSVIGAVLLIITIAGLWMFLYERNRSQQLSLVAGQLGLQFSRDKSPSIPGIGRFALFSRGRLKTFYNTMQGSVEGVRVAVFDYRFTSGTGKSQSVHCQTVCAILDEKLGLPRFELKPEGFFHKLGALFGYQDIDFPENTGFSGKYVLCGENEGQVRAAFTPEVLSFFEMRPGLYVEGGNNTIIFFKAGKRLKPGEVQNFLLEGIRGLVVFRMKGSG